MTLSERPCACGRPFARVTAIEGRREDSLRLRAAGGGPAQVQVHACRLRAPLIGVPGLRQFQMVHHAERVHLRISVREGARAEEVVASATAALRKALEDAGAAASVSAEVVDRIERAGSAAKERLVVAAMGSLAP